MLKFRLNNNIIIEHNSTNISIDPLKKTNSREFNFITHAHKDHIGKNLSNEYCYLTTEPTLEIINLMYNENKKSNTLEFNKKYKHDDIQYKIINSGHVLGSYSLILEHNGTKITITSDLNTIDTTTTKATIPEDTDILIIESTYGSLNDVFPERQLEYTRFLKWLILNRLNNKLPIISSYPLGKTQEIAKLISDNTNFNIGLTKEAFNITNVYTKNNIFLKNYDLISKNINELDVLILPPGKITKTMVDALATTSKKNLAFASTTGNALRFGEQFKISDHCDCNELLNYITNSNAKQVYTYHGKDNEFANIVSKKIGCYAKALKDIKTLEIV